MSATLSIAPETARRFLALRHFLAPPRSLPPGREGILSRLRAVRLDPVRSARGRRPQPRPRSPCPRSGLPPRADRRPPLRGARPLRDLQQGPQHRPDGRPALLPDHLGSATARAEGGGVFDEHAPLVEELLERIRADGHLSSTDIAPRDAIDWYWRPTNQVRAILEALAQSGILGIARRDGNRRIYDLVERLFPADLLAERPPERRAAPLQAPVALPRPRPPRDGRPGGDLDGHGPPAARVAPASAARS